jgi:hypothetical protein
LSSFGWVECEDFTKNPQVGADVAGALTD